jgi:hypothetical protein
MDVEAREIPGNETLFFNLSHLFIPLTLRFFLSLTFIHPSHPSLFFYPSHLFIPLTLTFIMSEISFFSLTSFVNWEGRDRRDQRAFGTGLKKGAWCRHVTM